MEYPAPSTVNHWPEANIRVAVIMSMVRVPVLSLLIALVEPSVSTSLRFFTTACASASRCAPKDNMAVRNVGRPDGIAAMAVVIPNRITSLESRPRYRPRATMIATAPHATNIRRKVSWRISLRNGETPTSTELSIPAILPISVREPVSVMTTVAVPRVIDVPW